MHSLHILEVNPTDYSVVLVEPHQPAEYENSEEDDIEDDKAIGEGDGGGEGDDDKYGDGVRRANDHEIEGGDGNLTLGELYKVDGYDTQATSLTQSAPEGDIEILDGTTAICK